jgi:peptidyl-dipeptidase A
MVEKYQFIKKPAGRNNPDWAAKIHLSSSPVYYHNYQLGEILASQLINYIEKNIGPFDKARTQKAFGNYLKDKIFKLGSIYKWNDLIEHATGEKLTAKYFAKAYLK